MQSVLFKNLMSKRVQDVSNLVLDLFLSERKKFAGRRSVVPFNNQIYHELKNAHLDDENKTYKKQKVKKSKEYLKQQINDSSVDKPFSFCFFENAYDCYYSITYGLTCKCYNGIGLKRNKSLFDHTQFWKYNYALMVSTLGLNEANQKLQNLFASNFYSQRKFLACDNAKKIYGTYGDNVRFFPASPDKQHLLPKLSVQYIPIQATWKKNIYDKNLSVCKIYDGFAERNMIVTHLARVVREEKLSPQDHTPYQMLEGYVLYPVVVPDKASKYTLELRKTLLLKDPNKYYTEAFKHPEWNKSLSPQQVEQEIQKLFEKIMEKTRKTCNVKTLNMITNDKGPSFKTLYRNMTPTVFLES